MFSSRKHIVPLFVYLSLLLASATAHDLSIQQRDHVNLKRIMKKRSPFPQDVGGILLPGAIGAAPIPSSSSEVSVSAVSTSASSASSSSASSSASSTSASSSASASASSSTASSTGSASSTTSSAASSSAPSVPPAQSSEALNVTGAGPSVIFSTGTVTATSSAEPSQTFVPDAQANSSTESTAKGMTMTVLIAVAASIGGIAIIWTVFRKWKLSSSKAFDRRLNPIDWQPTTGEDDIIPSHRRAPSNGSSRSGSGHGHSRAAGAGASAAGSAYGHGSNSDHGHGHASANPFADFDSPVNGAPVGGYADLNRGPSPTNPMQEHLQRGPSFNRAVPIHHQGYDAYPNGPRY